MLLLSRPMATWRTLDDAASQVGVSRRTLQRWISERRIRAYSIAGDRRAWVDLDEIRALREPRPRMPQPQAGRAEKGAPDTGSAGSAGEAAAQVEATEAEGEGTGEGE